MKVASSPLWLPTRQIYRGWSFCWRFCQVVVFAGGFSQGSSFSGRFARRVSICWPFCQSVVCFSGRFARGVNFAGRFARSSVFLAVLPGRRQSLFYCREGFPYNWCQKQPIHTCAHTRTPPHLVSEVGLGSKISQLCELYLLADKRQINAHPELF